MVHHGLFSNRAMNVRAAAAIAFLLLAMYLRPLREALHFAALTPGDLMVSAALSLLLIAPAELRKARYRRASGRSDLGAAAAR